MGVRSLKTASMVTGVKRSKFWDQSAVVLPPGSYESIQTITLGSAAPSVTFNSIPQTYKHLQVRSFIRNGVATIGGQSQLRLNGDSGLNYTYHTLYATGSGSVSSSGDGNYNWSYGADRFAGGNDTANTFGASILDFLDYSNTSKFKTFRSFGGYDANGSGQIRLHSSLWMSTSAITTIYFENQGGGNYAAGSQFALYGIKG